jgi:hypothetical protein
MKSILTCRVRSTVFLVLMSLLCPGVAQAQTGYQIQSLVTAGDTVGGVAMKAESGYLAPVALNDSGQLLVGALGQAGDDLLFQYAGGKLTLLVAGGKAAPTPEGKWPRSVFIGGAGMNQSGNVVFSAGVISGNRFPADTYLWEYKAQALKPLVRRGMPALQDLTFAQGGGFGPAINNRGDVALVAQIEDGPWQETEGTYFLGRDGQLLPVVQPGQALPDGRKALRAINPTINDAGMIGVPVHRQEDGFDVFNSYLWDPSGELRPVALAGTEAPGGGKIVDVKGAFVNNKNSNVLVAIRLNSLSSGPWSLYLFRDGKLTPAIVPGQEMPGGGKLQTIAHDALSYASEAGEHLFFARLQGGATAYYRLDASGIPSLVLKKGDATSLGAITHLGTDAGAFGGAINSKGQVALVARFDGGPSRLVLLTPSP